MPQPARLPPSPSSRLLRGRCHARKPVRTRPKRRAAEPFAQWPAVCWLICEETDAMLISYLRGHPALTTDGRRVLFECSDAFRDFMRRSNREASKKHESNPSTGFPTSACGIGPYARPLQLYPTLPMRLMWPATLRQMNMQALGV